MAGQLVKALIGKEDCDIATDENYPSTFTRVTSVGGAVTLTSFPDIWKTHQSIINAKYYGAHDATRSTLGAAVSAQGTTNQRCLIIDPGTWLITDDLDLSAYLNVFFSISPGALLQISGGKTLTLYSPANIIAQPGQRIKTGAGLLAFSTGTGRIYPQWYGAAAAYPTLIDDGPAIQEAWIAARACGSELHIPAGNYYVHTQATVGSDGSYSNAVTGVYGRSRIFTDVVDGAMKVAITLANPDVDSGRIGGGLFDGIEFRGIDTSNTGRGLSFVNTQTTKITNCWFENLAEGIRFAQSDLITIERNRFNHLNYGVNTTSSGAFAVGGMLNSFNFINNIVSECVTEGVHYDGGHKPSFVFNNFVSNGKAIVLGVESVNSTVVSHPTVEHNYFESGVTNDIVIGGGTGIVRGGSYQWNEWANVAPVCIKVGNSSNTFGQGKIDNNFNPTSGGAYIFAQISGSAEKPYYSGTYDLSDTSGGNPSVIYGTPVAWTPTLIGSVTPGDQTYGLSTGSYVRNGKQVSLNFVVTLTNKGTISGNISIGGLPFPASSTAANVRYAAGPIGFYSLTTTWISIIGYAGESATAINLSGVTAAATGLTALTDAALSNTTQLHGSFTYNVD